jgi:type I restriction enzyme S subunit
MDNDKTMELPHTWLRVTLDYVAQWGSGGTPSRSIPDFYKGVIPWIKTGELGQKYIRCTDEHISEEAIKKSSAKVFPAGSIGIAMYGATIGKLSIFGVDASTNQACAVAQPYEKILNNEYLYYFLLSEKKNLIDAGKGGAQPNISQGILKDWLFSLPPLPEQHRIVAKIEALFSELDKGIESLKTAQQQLKIYRQALLKHAFSGKLTEQWRAENQDKLETAEALLQRIQTEREQRYQAQLKEWETNGKQGTKPKAPKVLPPLTDEELAELPELPVGWAWFLMGDICQESVLGKMLDKAKNKGDLKPYLRNINVRWGEFSLGNLLEMKFEESELERYRLKDGDLVICEGGEPARCAVWKKEFGQNMYIQKALHRVRFTNSVDSVLIQMYFKFCSSSKSFQKMLTGTTIKHLTGEKLSRMVLPICLAEEQKQIRLQLESRLSITDQLEQTITTALQQSEVLRQSILKKAFSGQLVPQDPNDEPASVLLERIKTEKAALINPVKTVTKKIKSGKKTA